MNIMWLFQFEKVMLIKEGAIVGIGSSREDIDGARRYGMPSMWLVEVRKSGTRPIY